MIRTIQFTVFLISSRMLNKNLPSVSSIAPMTIQDQQTSCCNQKPRQNNAFLTVAAFNLKWLQTSFVKVANNKFRGAKVEFSPTVPSKLIVLEQTLKKWPVWINILVHYCGPDSIAWYHVNTFVFLHIFLQNKFEDFSWCS